VTASERPAQAPGKARLVIPVNLGTPREPSPEAVRSFLAEFLSDPAVVDFPAWLWKPVLHGIILKSRPRRVAELYREIWTSEGSPLEVDTRRIAAGLQSLIDAGNDIGCETGSDPGSVAGSGSGSGSGGDAGSGADGSADREARTKVRWAYRYGQPSLASRLEEGRKLQGAEIVVLPLYAQHTSSTSGTVVDEAGSLARSMGIENRLRMALLEPDDRGYLDAITARFRHASREESWEPEHILLSFHGIPARYDRREGQQYSRDCERTAKAIIEDLDWDPGRATLCYQSKFGPERWLTPSMANLLEALPATGIRRLAVLTPGFLTEGLETIEEIGIRGKEAFLAAGGTHFLRVPASGDHPAILQSLARLATSTPHRS
jgi:ferrochelatase